MANKKKPVMTEAQIEASTKASAGGAGAEIERTLKNIRLAEMAGSAAGKALIPIPFVGGRVGRALAGAAARAAVDNRPSKKKEPVKKAKGGMIKKYSPIARPQRFSGLY